MEELRPKTSEKHRLKARGKWNDKGVNHEAAR